MDHRHASFFCNLDDFILSQIGSHRSVLSKLTNLIRFISLEGTQHQKMFPKRKANVSDSSFVSPPGFLFFSLTYLVPMHRESVFVREDGYSSHRKFMSSAEHTNGDFLTVGEIELELTESLSFVCDCPTYTKQYLIPNASPLSHMTNTIILTPRLTTISFRRFPMTSLFRRIVSTECSRCWGIALC